jgi:hypothetical protein
VDEEKISVKFKTTIILFAVFVVLLAVVLLFEYKGKGEKDEEEKLLAISSEEVQKIAFKKDGEKFTFQKDKEGEWFIIEPIEAKADKYEVDRLADDFSDLKAERIVEEEPEKLEKYGIPQKEISIWLKDKDEPIRILVGMENPLDNTFFAKRDDEPRVVLIPSNLKSLMEKTLFDFREKNIFKFETDDVKSVKLRAKETRWQASRKGEEWFFRNPVNALAEGSKVDNILSSLSNLKAKEFVLEEKKKLDIKKYGLDSPEYEITLGMPLENREVTFSLHKKEDKLYATTSLSTKIVEAEDTLLTDIEKEAEELREKEVANFYSWEANRLHLKMG